MARRTRPDATARESHLKPIIALGIILIAGLVTGFHLWCFYAADYLIVAQIIKVVPVKGGVPPGVFVLGALMAVLGESYFSSRRLVTRRGVPFARAFFWQSLAYVPCLALLPDAFYYTYVGRQLPYVSILLFPLVIALVVSVKLLWMPGAAQAKDEAKASSKRYGVAVVVLMVAYVSYFSWLTIRRYHCLNIGYSDAGLFWEIVKHSAQGKPFFSNHYLFKPPRVMQQTFLSLHVQPILLLLVPFYWLSSRLETLFVVQAAVIASGALAVYMLAKDELERPNLALVMAGAYLLYPPLHNLHLNYYYGFHPVSLAIPFLLFAFVFLRRRNTLVFALFVMLALFCKENVGLVVFTLGVYIFFFQKRKRLGATTAVVGIAWTVICAQVIIPHFRGKVYPFWQDLYPELGAQLTHPWRLVGQVFFHRKVAFLLTLLAPLGLLALCSPSTLMLVVFPLAISLLVKNQTPVEGGLWAYYSTLFHNHSLIVPGIFMASVMGMKRILSWQPKLGALLSRVKAPVELRRVHLGGPLWGLVLASSLLCANFLGSLPFCPPYKFRFLSESVEMPDRARQIPELRARIPAEASLVATDFVAAHFLDRDKLRVLPPGETTLGDDYVLLDLNDRRLQLDFSGESRRRLEALVSALADRRDYEKRFEYEGLVLFARVETGAFRDAERAPSPAPNQPE